MPAPTRFERRQPAAALQLRVVQRCRAAAAGDVDAMVWLAEHYESEGEWNLAHRFRKKAARRGHVRSAGMVGDSYHDGRGGAEVSAERAARWWREAAEAGDRESMYQLGKALIAAAGVQRSHAAGVAWLKRAKGVKSEERVLQHALEFYGEEGRAPDGCGFLGNREATGFISAIGLIRAWPDDRMN
eukprot:TRINITY_DN23573_c0_g1_i1.p1 TRINITY_DN23573_c0_g1~~TRINITY_DN23573_c0_g1_i1.p1  ORF type:complete len:186 (+),score=31.38 TRINITY_DN23573_c0_g1_i1:185-742(+)